MCEGWWIFCSYSRIPGNRVLVLHGHQHEELRYELRDRRGGHVCVSGLGSSTLGGLTPASGASRLQLDGEHRYAQIGFDSEIGWMVQLQRVRGFADRPSGDVAEWPLRARSEKLDRSWATESALIGTEIGMTAKVAVAGPTYRGVKARKLAS
jgi:hypothetical protein